MREAFSEVNRHQRDLGVAVLHRHPRRHPDLVRELELGVRDPDRVLGQRHRWPWRQHHPRLAACAGQPERVLTSRGGSVVTHLRASITDDSAGSRRSRGPADRFFLTCVPARSCCSTRGAAPASRAAAQQQSPIMGLIYRKPAASAAAAASTAAPERASVSYRLGPLTVNSRGQVQSPAGARTERSGRRVPADKLVADPAARPAPGHGASDCQSG